MGKYQFIYRSLKEMFENNNKEYIYNRALEESIRNKVIKEMPIEIL